jgi:transcriptional regulator with XRE-family HTH domain
MGMKFHLALHALLDTHKLTSYRLGEISGISRSNISKLLHGSNQPSMDTLERVARALEMKPSQLLEYVEDYEGFILEKRLVRDIEGLRNHPLLKLPLE